MFWKTGYVSGKSSKPFKVQVEWLAYVETVMNHLIP